jgi:hypothetical protein
MVTMVGLVVFVIGGLGAAVAWERQEDARSANFNRREQIDRAYRFEGFEAGTQYATSFSQADPDAWRAAALVLGCAAACGGATAVAGHSRRRPTE